MISIMELRRRRDVDLTDETDEVDEEVDVAISSLLVIDCSSSALLAVGCDVDDDLESISAAKI